MSLTRSTPQPLGKDRVGILIDNPRMIVSLKWGRHCSAKLGSFSLKKKKKTQKELLGTEKQGISPWYAIVFGKLNSTT